LSLLSGDAQIVKKKCFGEGTRLHHTPPHRGR
jgi:hypothetical protein